MSSLVPNDPFSIDEPLAAGRLQPAHSGPGREVNLMGLAWKSRWLILLMTLIGGGAAWAVLQRVTPRYTSVSRIYVERDMPQLLGQDIQMGQSTTYLYTQAELIRSTPVLAAAVDHPDNANLEVWREVDNRVAFLRDELVVSVGSQDDIINVMLELPSGEEAAQLVNSVVDAYITRYAEQRRTNAVEILTILRNEMQRNDKDLEKAEQALADFRKQNVELAVQMQDGNVVTQRFAALSEELNRTEIELLQAKALFNRLKRMYDTPKQRPFLFEMAGSEHQALRDIELERQVQSVEQALATEMARWGEGHPQVKLLRNSLSELQQKLAKKQEAVIEAYVESARQNYELLDQKRDELQTAYDQSFSSATDASAKLLELKALEEAYERTKEDSVVLNERIKEVDLTEKAGAMIEIMEVAAPSELPTYPSRARFLAVGILLGGLVGFGLAWLREMLDHRLKSVDEITDLLQLSVLGVVPYSESSGDRTRAGQMVAHSPRSSVAEAIRTLRTALHFSLAGEDVKVIAVTSPFPGDGKSTVASNLAIAMAQADQRVLLIDADLRKPSQQMIFQAPMEKGLASVLGARLPVADAILPSGVPSLDILPCGPLPANPVELLNNGFFSELLENLKGRYDKIIIDSPPVMPVADARVIAAISDSTLLVLRAERSTRRGSLGARNELWRVRAARLAVVLNGVPTRKQGAYGYGDTYGYGYGAGGYGQYGAIEEDSSSSRSRKKSRALVAAHVEPDDHSET